MSARTIRLWKYLGTVLLGVIAVWFALMFAMPRWAKAAHDVGSVEEVRRYGMAMTLTPRFLQGWQTPYNLGTAQAFQKHYHSAVDNLTTALERVPKANRGMNGQVQDPTSPECQVRRNLSLSHEKIGDDLKANGQAAASAKKYGVASSVIAPCTEHDQKSEELQRRQDQKKSATEPDSPEPPPQDPSQNPSQDPGQSPPQNPGQDPSQGSGQNPSQNPGQGSSSSAPSQQPPDLLRDSKEQALDDKNRQGGKLAERERSGRGTHVDW